MTTWDRSMLVLAIFMAGYDTAKHHWVWLTINVLVALLFWSARQDEGFMPGESE